MGRRGEGGRVCVWSGDVDPQEYVTDGLCGPTTSEPRPIGPKVSKSWDTSKILIGL